MRYLIPLLLLAACAPQPPDIARFDEPELEAVAPLQGRPDDPDGCYARDAAKPDEAEPDETEPDETSAENAVIWFETPCPDIWTEDFIATLQRALIARDLLDPPATGQMTQATLDAIREFQRPLGIDSDKLSVAAGKRLGLIAYDRDEIGEA